MTKFVLSIVFFILSSGLYAQTCKFHDAVREELIRKDVLSEINRYEITEDYYDFTNRKFRDLEELILSEISKKSRNYIHPIKESAALDQLSKFCTLYWGNSVYASSKKWAKMKLHLKRALRHVECGFGLFHSASFRLNLMNDNKGEFYYDRKGEKNQLNLIKGKPPITKEEKENYIPEPLDFLTEKQIIEKVWKQLKSKRIFAGLNSGLYYSVGISIEIDKKTLYKNKIPSARVVIICGAKRLHLIEKKHVKRKQIAN